MNPIFFNPQGLFATTDKGTQIMNNLLHTQYQNSPNLKEYMGAFIAELDILFEEVEKVYLGRFLEYATGTQLDIIGDLLGLSRAIALPNTWFGFTDDGVVTIPGIAGFSDASIPAEGGRLRDHNNTGFTVTPLDDITYRRALLVKALCNNQATLDVNTQYFLIQTLMGKVPALLELTSPAARKIQLNIAQAEVTQSESALIQYMSRYFIPTGTTFIINRT